MKDIVKEIREFEAKGCANDEALHLIKETLISRDYFMNEVLRSYPDLEFTRIFMKNTTITPSFYESFRDEEYYLYSVFIGKNMLEYISGDVLIGNLNGEKIIDLSNVRWKEQIELRNKIIKVCPIIMAECNYYTNYMEISLSNIDMELSRNISIYPHDYKIKNYELLNSTKFILISNSSSVSQKELENLCLEMLEKLSQENLKVINDGKAIYLSISEKLKRNKTLNQEERKILEGFINGEIDRIEKENSLLVRSKVRSRQ